MELKTLGIYGPYPKAGGSACSSYLVRTEKAKLVLDFGTGALTRLTAEEDVCSVDAIILSHTHFDHVSDMLPLTYLMELRPGKLKVYLPKNEDNWYLKLLNKSCFEAHEVEAGDKEEINGALVERQAHRSDPRDKNKRRRQKPVLYGRHRMVRRTLRVRARRGYGACGRGKAARVQRPAYELRQSLSVERSVRRQSPSYPPFARFRSRRQAPRHGHRSRRRRKDV